MRHRHALLTILAIALGAITTIGIAWSLAVVGVRPTVLDPRPASVAVLIDDRTAVVCDVLGNGIGWTWVSMSRLNVFSSTPQTVIPVGISRTDTPFPRAHSFPSDAHPPGSNATSRTEMQLGWPCRSMGGAQDDSRYADMIMPVGRAKIWVLRNGIPAYYPFILTSSPGNNPPTAIEVPTGVLWKGALIDTALFAMAWGSLLFGVPRVLRAIRRRRGLCERCKYDMKGLPPATPCPECGRTPATR